MALALLELIEQRARMGESPADGLNGMVDLEADAFGRGGGWEPHGASGDVMLHYLEALCVLQAADVSGFGDNVRRLSELFYRYIFDAENGITYDSFDGTFDRPDNGIGASL